MDYLLAITWEMDPTIFKIGFLEIRWYGLCFALSFLIGQSIMERVFKEEGKKEKDLDALVLYMVVATILGARLGHCLFYAPDYYLKNPVEILKIWEGGLASHGGAIGIIIGLGLYVRGRSDQSFMWVLDRIVIPVALAAFLVRLGNLMNSEIVGRPTDLPWAVVFANAASLSEEARGIPRHPAQMYESLSSLLLFVGLFTAYWRYKAALPRGRFFGTFLVYVFTLRFFYEFLKENQEAFESDMQQAMGLNMGQMLSIPMVVVGVVILAKSFGENAQPTKAATK